MKISNVERKYFLDILDAVLKTNKECGYGCNKWSERLNFALGELRAFCKIYHINSEAFRDVEYWELLSIYEKLRTMSLKDFNEEVYAA